MSRLARPHDRAPACLAGKGNRRDMVEAPHCVRRTEDPLP